MILENVVTVGKENAINDLAAQISKKVFTADDVKEAAEITQRINPELMLYDSRCGNIQELLNFKKINTNISIIVIGNDENQNADEEFKGTCNFYLRGKQEFHQLQEIVKGIKNQIKNFISKQGDDLFLDDFAGSIGMVGKSQATKHTLKMIRLVAASQCNPILIIGETGTGKEVAAKAVHVLKHPNEKFVAVNCAALTANLLESELFGHVKGAFTGADSDKTGLLELAGEGTIFLDEITEMPMDLQAKLLRVLQEKTFRKVGGTKESVCKATIITTSNRNLRNEVKVNRLRSDLYYRLNIFPIIMAPLRAPERKDDLPLLIDYFLKTLKPTDEKTILTKLAMEALQKHDWPGNIRELRNVIERALLLETTDKIGLSSIVLEPTEFAWSSDNSMSEKIKDFSLAKAEQELILKALQAVNWQKTQAAELLGISRATLYTKVKQYCIKDDSSNASEVSNTEILSPFSTEPLALS